MTTMTTSHPESDAAQSSGPAPRKRSLLARVGSSLGTILALGVSAFGFWFGLAGHKAEHAGDEHASRELPPVMVTVAEVTARDLEERISVVGTLFGQEEFVLVPKVDGRLSELIADVGDHVKAGDVLARLDDTDYRLQVEEAQRALEQELAKLGLTSLPDETMDLTTLPSVIKANAQLRNVQQRVDRILQLYAKNAVTESERQAVETELDVAKADRQQMLLDAQTILATARYRDAALKTAQQKLDDTVVRVPGAAATEVNYVVTTREVSSGQMVYGTPGMSTTLFRLAIVSPIELKAAIAERYRAQVREGLEVQLEVDAHPGRVFRGSISRISPSVDRASRTYEIEALFVNEDLALAPGSFAKAFIVSSPSVGALTVPEEAVVSFAGVNKVFVVEGDGVREVQVRLGKETSAPSGESTSSLWVQVEGQLSAGDRVVTSGQTRLADGSKIVLKTAP